MSQSSTLVPVSNSDSTFLANLYASTRASEMELVPWSDEQKRDFLLSQFEAQANYYRERYPHASFDLVKIDGRPAGRFYVAELADEIRIIDLAFLPEFFEERIFVSLIEETLKKGAACGKPVSIYLERESPQTEIFVRLGFKRVGEHGVYVLWKSLPAHK